MDKMLISAVLLIVIGIVLNLLYTNGYFVINAKRALMYIGSMRGRKAIFTSCNGYTKRMIRFSENGLIEFHLDLQISKGDVTMELVDDSKKCILLLNNAKQSDAIHVDAKKKYYLVFRFKSATGSYLLTKRTITDSERT